MTTEQFDKLLAIVNAAKTLIDESERLKQWQSAPYDLVPGYARMDHAGQELVLIGIERKLQENVERLESLRIPIDPVAVLPCEELCSLLIACDSELSAIAAHRPPNLDECTALTHRCRNAVKRMSGTN